jgi:hypothetical protein
MLPPFLHMGLALLAHTRLLLSPNDQLIQHGMGITNCFD